MNSYDLEHTQCFRARNHATRYVCGGLKPSASSWHRPASVRHRNTATAPHGPSSYRHEQLKPAGPIANRPGLSVVRDEEARPPSGPRMAAEAAKAPHQTAAGLSYACGTASRGGCDRRATTTGKSAWLTYTPSRPLSTLPPANRPAAVSPMGERGGGQGPQPGPKVQARTPCTRSDTVDGRRVRPQTTGMRRRSRPRTTRRPGPCATRRTPEPQTPPLGATLGSTGANDLQGIRTRMNSGQGLGRGHGLI
jgi:hypothetical protein